MGVGCIDVSICSLSATVAIADIGRGLVITDLSGRTLTELRVPYPCWGVAHRLRKNGQLLVAIAAASKTPRAGKIVIYLDRQIVVDYDLESPAWDVVLLPDGGVAASCWDGRVYVWDEPFSQEPNSILLSENAPVFGLSALADGTILANLENCGLYSIDASMSIATPFSPSKTNAYNIAVSSDGTKVASGGYGPTGLLLSLPDRHSHHIPGQEIRAVEFMGDILLTGESSGVISAWTPSMSDTPLMTFNLEADIWAFDYAQEVEVLAVALGDGRVMCFEPALHDTALANARRSRTLLAQASA